MRTSGTRVAGKSVLRNIHIFIRFASRDVVSDDYIIEAIFQSDKFILNAFGSGACANTGDAAKTSAVNTDWKTTTAFMDASSLERSASIAMRRDSFPIRASMGPR